MEDEYWEDEYEPILIPDEKFKNRGPLLVKISIFDLDTGEQIRDHTRDIRKRKDREWLTKVTMWAIMNNKRIEIRKK